MIGPLPYVGGKRRIAPLIVRLLPPHTTYVEPFAGGAQVFFHKSPSAVEVLNDRDGDIINFLRVCQHHQNELLRWLRYALPSVQLHHWFASQDPSALTDIQRAARFLYLQKNSFGGRVRGRSFHYGVTTRINFRPERLADVLTATANRLLKVQLECLPYERVLARYDRPSTCFYLDPPYAGRSLYRFNFRTREFFELAQHLEMVRGTFVLSVNDHPVCREAFGRFHCRQVSLPYTVSPLVPNTTELLFSNRPLAR